MNNERQEEMKCPGRGNASRAPNRVLSQEETAEILSMASKVGAWMSALKRKSERRPFTGACEDSSIVLTICNHRIESIQTNGNVANMSPGEIVSRVCEAHNDALDKMEDWTAAQCEVVAKTCHIEGDVQLPF